VTANPYSDLIEQREEEITTRILQSLEAGVNLRIERLREQFGLDDFEVNTLVLCIAPEIGLKYEMLYAYLQGDVSKRRPTVNLALNLFCKDISERIVRRNSLAGESSLMQHELVHLSEASGGRQGALLGSSIIPDSRIVDYLLGSSAIEITLRPFVHIQEDELASWDGVVLPADTRKRLMAADGWLAQERAHQAKTVLQLVGLEGSGKKTIVQAICRSLGRRLLTVNVRGLLAAGSESVRLIALAFREALLQDAVLCLDEFHALLDEDAQRQAALAAVHDWLGRHGDLVVLAGEQHWRVEGSIEERAFLTCRIPSPDSQERRSLWDIHLDGQRGRLTADDPPILISKVANTTGIKDSPLCPSLTLPQRGKGHSRPTGESSSLFFLAPSGGELERGTGVCLDIYSSLGNRLLHLQRLNRQHLSGPQVLRVVKVVGVGDEPPGGGVAVLVVCNPVYRVPRLDYIELVAQHPPRGGVLGGREPSSSLS
jgi:hypothetical protein